MYNANSWIGHCTTPELLDHFAMDNMAIHDTWDMTCPYITISMTSKTLLVNDDIASKYMTLKEKR